MCAIDLQARERKPLKTPNENDPGTVQNLRTHCQRPPELFGMHGSDNHRKKSDKKGNRNPLPLP